MVQSVPAPDRVIRAFADATRDASATQRSVEQRDGSVFLRDGGDTINLVSTSGKEGTPYRPSISADGQRAAWLRRVPGKHEHIEITNVHTGLLGSLRRLVGRNYITFSNPVKSIDLNKDGTRLACLEPDRLTMYPLQRGPWIHHDLPKAAPGAIGVRQTPVDVEYLDDGSVAILTDAGTAYGVDEQGNVTRFSMPHGNDNVVAALDASERQPLLDAYGDSLLAVAPGPDSRQCVLQVRAGNGVDNLILDRQTNEIHVIGKGVEKPPLWSPDGRFVAVAGDDGALVHPVFGHARPLAANLDGAHWTADSLGFELADGRTVPLRQALTGWEIDLGATTPEAGAVVQEERHVVINGIKVQRRA